MVAHAYISAMKRITPFLQYGVEENPIYLRFKIILNKNVIVRSYWQMHDYNAHLSRTMILQT